MILIAYLAYGFYSLMRVMNGSSSQRCLKNVDKGSISHSFLTSFTGVAIKYFLMSLQLKNFLTRQFFLLLHLRTAVAQLSYYG